MCAGLAAELAYCCASRPLSTLQQPRRCPSTRVQAAVAADLAVVWREKMLGGQGDVEGQQYNFPLQG